MIGPELHCGGEADRGVFPRHDLCVTNQRVTFHYNCIGAFEVPDRRRIPERDILMEMRKGIALSYALAQIVI